MFITFVEIKHGMLAMALIALGVLALLLLISGVHLLAREIARSLKRRRARRASPQPRQHLADERLYAGAGD